MSNSRHLLPLACAQALALSCAHRPELARSHPAISQIPGWGIESALRSTPAAAPSVSNPYAPTRTLAAGVYSWQSNKRTECPSEPSARVQRSAASGLLASFPEPTPEPVNKVQPVSPDSVVLALRPAIHHCYSRWLEARVDAQGSVRFALELGCTGDVRAISAENQGVDEGTLACLFSAVAPARFAPPVGGRATVLVPVVFKNAAR